MADSHAAAGFVRLFPSEDIPRTIQNIQICCKSLVRQTPFELENSLSKRLYRQLCQLAEYRCGPIVPLWEPWLVHLTETDAEITGRGDILFSCGGLETYFLVEAKRLFVTYPKGKKDSLVSDYINDGMMRFVTGQYSAKMTAGAMLGYVCDSTVPKAKAALIAAIARHAGKLQLTTDGVWRESSIEVAPLVAETQHGLVRGHNFTIYHVLTKV
jgi:hypothetical protein